MSREEYDRKCIELQICLREFREHSANARAAAKAKADLYFNGILPALVKENSFRKKEAEAREKLEKTQEEGKERLKKIEEEDIALAILRKKMAAMDLLTEEIESGLINSEEAYRKRYQELVGEPLP